MRITSIEIQNLAAFKELKVALPAVALVEGQHGVGKSSLERCIMYAFGLRPLAEKGQKAIMHDPTILHGIAESGHAILSFDEGALESLRVRVIAEKTERTIKVRGKKAWELAGQQIYDITNALSYNPLQFRELAPKERLEAFLKVVPVEISKEEVLAAVGDQKALIGDKPSLETINSIYDDIYSARRDVNVAADTQSKHAAQLEQAVGPEAPAGDWDSELKKLRADKETLDRSEQQEIARIGRELAAKKDGAADVRRSADAATDTAINSGVSELRQQIQKLEKAIGVLETQRVEEKATASAAESSAIEVLRAAANAEVSEIRSHNAPLHQKLTADIATAEERARKAAQDEGTRAAAKTAREEANAHLAKSQAMTEALERLKALKAAVAGRMKVKGVTVASPREGAPVDICREEDGALVPFSGWNSADQDQFCMRIAMLYRGACGLVMIDNVGNWNAARRDAILASCRKYAGTGMQFLLGSATDGELRITDVTEAK